MWIQYSANIRGDIFSSHHINRDEVFIEPEGHLINVKTDLSDFWAELQGKIKKDPKIMQIIEDELESRVFEKFKYEAAYGGFQGVNNLNGGIYSSESKAV
jgi:hypothetical protein